MRLLRLVTWPYVRRHALRTALTALGVVLGIAVFVGMHAANQRVVAAFSETIDRIAGKTDLQITAGEAGFPEEILEKVQAARSVRVAVPVIEAVVRSRLEGAGDLMVLAVDMTGDRSLRDYSLEDSGTAIDDPLIFLAQPDSLIVSRELADKHGLRSGTRLTLETASGERPFTVRGIMKPEGLATAFGGNLAVMDVYAAQRMFGRGRTFDRIDVGVTSESSVAQAQHDLAASLGPGFDVQPPASRGQQAQALVAGYGTMVNLSSAFALFIGMFIIHNSFVTAVTQRRREVGILRALGATRSQIRNLFLIEGAVLGTLGALAGLAIGAWVARSITSTFGELAAQLYGVAEQPAAGAGGIDVRLLIGSASLGVVTSVIAAVAPARRAAHIEPIEAMQQAIPQAPGFRHTALRVIPGIALAIASVALLASGNRWLSYAGYLATVAASLVLAPLLSHALVRLLRPLLKRWWPVEGSLAGDSLLLAPKRTAGAVLALMFSLALVVAFAGIARSSYASVVQWLDTTMNPDLFVMPSQRLDLRTVRFPAQMAGDLAAIPGVGRVQMFRNTRATFHGKPVMVAAIEMDSVRHTLRQQPVAGNRDEMFTAAAAGRGVIVSDNLAQLYGLRLNDAVELAAPGGLVKLPIVGVLPDYTDQQGTIFLDRHVFVRYWLDDAVSDFRVFVSTGADPAEVRQRILSQLSGTRHVFVLTNTEARDYVLRVADRWFTLVNIQIAIAVVVAILGIVNALTVSVLDRRREIGVLKAVGALRGQIRRTIWLEAISVAAVGLVLGALLGAVLLRYLLDIVHRDAFGLRLDYVFPVGTVLMLVPVMLIAAIAAALWPSESAVRGSLVEALEYE